MTNIVDHLKDLIMQAFDRCRWYADRGNRGGALTQYGRACGLMQALKEIVGDYADMEGMKTMKDTIERQLYD